MDAHFRVQVAGVTAHRVLRDAQAFGDVALRAALADEFHDLKLAVGEAGVVPETLACVAERVEERRGHRGLLEVGKDASCREVALVEHEDAGHGEQVHDDGDERGHGFACGEETADRAPHGEGQAVRRPTHGEHRQGVDGASVGHIGEECPQQHDHERLSHGHEDERPAREGAAEKGQREHACRREDKRGTPQVGEVQRATFDQDNPDDACGSGDLKQVVDE